ncbi:MAG: cation transporter [Lachnospiraceae bacterium]|nr:cation transporter [Lachnospiraceae bacterium]
MKREHNLAYRVSAVSIAVNVILSVLKLAAGVLASSGAMISDAVHSASDVFSTVIVIAGVALSRKKSDADHQYGHERMECMASLLLAAVLALTGGGIGINGIQKIIGGSYETLAVPGRLALAAAVGSILVKEWMYWYTRAAAKKINSGALMADAWHHRSDALSSVGAMIGIFGARMGYPVSDAVASVVICLFIEKAAFDIFRDAADKMVDKSCPDELVEQMREVVKKEEGVIHIDDMKTRLFGDKIYVDVEFSADGSKSLEESHDIAERVHAAIEREFPTVKHCMVHVNPYHEGESVPLS